MKSSNPLSYRNAALMALAISAALHLFFFIMISLLKSYMFPHGGGGGGREIPVFDIWRIAFMGVATFIFLFSAYALNFRLLRSGLRRGWKLTWIILSTIVVSASLNFISIWLENVLFTPQHILHRGEFDRAIWGGLSKNMFLSIIVVFSSYLIYLSWKRQQMYLEFQKLKAENVRTKYEALKNQLDPHFLFNSLNALNALIDTDQQQAKEYVRQLSVVLRYTLQSKEVITLDEEVNFTKAYCALMEIRYGDPLRFAFDIDREYLGYLIVPLSLQTLVENAIKHNVVNRRQSLTVTVATNSDGSEITVSNPIQLRKGEQEGEGIGLRNLAERYRLKWLKDINISSGDDTFSVTIPLIKPCENDNN